MNSRLAKIGSFFGALGVALGAFGAHALKESLTKNGHFDTFEIAVRYQFYSAFVLILISFFSGKYSNKFIIWSGNLFTIGTVIFSGSLYLICLTGITTFGAIAPIGGLCLLAGWILLFFSFTK